MADIHYIGGKKYTQMDIFKDSLYKDIEPPSCLDSAYERRAIDDGMNNNPVFEENILYLKWKRESNGNK